MKAKVLLKDGFRFYKVDNTTVDVKAGDVFDAGEMGERDRAARIAEKHIEYVDEKTPSIVSPAVSADPLSPAGNIGLATKVQQTQYARDADARQKAEDAAAEKVLADHQAKATADAAKAAKK
jgi:hypothetical protein